MSREPNSTPIAVTFGGNDQQPGFGPGGSPGPHLGEEIRPTSLRRLQITSSSAPDYVLIC